MLAAATLRQHPGATVLHNLICSRTVPEVVTEHGGTPVRTRVGHSYIKQVMAETGAVFGGEHSAHYYFARNFNADSGLIASLMVMAEIGRSGLPLSKLREPFERYSTSGEINTQVDDAVAVIDRISGEFAESPAGPTSTGSPSTVATGGSTCGRRTPNHCCGSTSRRRPRCVR